VDRSTDDHAHPYTPTVRTSIPTAPAASRRSHRRRGRLDTSTCLAVIASSLVFSSVPPRVATSFVVVTIVSREWREVTLWIGSSPELIMESTGT
jgi:hypothetical protein